MIAMITILLPLGSAHIHVPRVSGLMYEPPSVCVKVDLLPVMELERRRQYPMLLPQSIIQSNAPV